MLVYNQRSSFGEHLGCFCPLAVVNTAAVDIVHCYLFKSPIPVVMGVDPEVELLDCMVIMCIIF